MIRVVAGRPRNDPHYWFNDGIGFHRRGKQN